MTQDDNDDSRSIGERGLDSARQAVYAATEQVDQVGQHIKKKVEATRRPETYVKMLKNIIKAVPLGMLSVAFLGGMLFARRR